jgi:hypothetical protein
MESSSLLLPSSSVEWLASQLLLQALFTESSCREQLLALSPFSSVLKAPYSLLHVLFSSLFIIQFCFLQGGGQSDQDTMLVYPRGGCVSTACCLFAHLLVCISQAGLESASGGAAAPLVSQCNVVCRSFVQAGGQGVRVLLILGGFFLLTMAPESQQDF